MQIGGGTGGGIASLPYPSFPTWGGSISTLPNFFMLLFIWLLQTVVTVILNLIITLINAFGSGGSQLISAALGYMTTSYNTGAQGLSQFGIFAPLIGALIFIGTAFIIVIGVTKLFKFEAREVED